MLRRIKRLVFHCNQMHHPLALLELQRSELFFMQLRHCDTRTFISLPHGKRKNRNEKERKYKKLTTSITRYLCSKFHLTSSEECTKKKKYVTRKLKYTVSSAIMRIGCNTIERQNERCLCNVNFRVRLSYHATSAIGVKNFEILP